ncbi:hypothetical protein NPIL_530771 [Nephila pilipes]|uniref:Uncharacterized protein n=1 Tax=Nephila pilipes TaxID=299642 RepID=A0A8X6PGQ4_NEPPI|nr:hypothetical protein NPIL_530771 [Nephila pilipes]
MAISPSTTQGRVSSKEEVRKSRSKAEKKAPSPPLGEEAHDLNEDRRCAGPWSFPLLRNPRNKPDSFSVQEFRDSKRRP